MPAFFANPHSHSIEKGQRIAVEPEISVAGARNDRPLKTVDAIQVLRDNAADIETGTFQKSERVAQHRQQYFYGGFESHRIDNFRQGPNREAAVIERFVAAEKNNGLVDCGVGLSFARHRVLTWSAGAYESRQFI